jgi:3-oxoacyl-[acyl-carrier-protein] synthase II
MIAGGVSSRTHPALWTRQQVIGQSQRFDDPQGASRPFDADRDGIVPGEGSGAVVLESAARAKQRGANILARVLGYATSFEPHAKGQPLQGTAMRHAIALSLETAELKPADVGCVVAHGASTRDGDRIEAQAIHDMLGDVPVTAPKSLYGHLGAAAGSLEMAVSVLSLQHGQIPPTLNYQRPDPECPVRVVRGGFEPLKHSTALILAHSRHGQAAAIVLDGSSA